MKYGTIAILRCERSVSMEDFINNIKNVVSPDALIYIIIGLVAIILLSVVMMVLRQKNTRNHLEDLDDQYNILKAVPLTFKLNKALALSRVNEAMLEQVEVCKSDFDVIQEKLKECAMLLADIDDMIYMHKSKAARRKLSELQKKLSDCKQRSDLINKALEDILEQENEQRTLINKLKEQFRQVKNSINENRSTYAQSYEYMELEITMIEKMFSTFEEWMFASEFNKAADQQKEIKEHIEHLSKLVDVLPSLYERAKGVLPRTMDEVGFEYAQAKNKGVFLEHIEVHKNLELISDMLKDDLNKLRNGKIEHVVEDINDCEKRVRQLQEMIRKENLAFDEVDENVEQLFQNVETINTDVTNIHNLYEKVCARFGFENWTDRLKELDRKLEVLNDMKRKMKKVLLDQSLPYATILVAYRELEQSSATFEQEVLDMKGKLDGACSDEERAQKQLIKLQLIINEIRVKMSKNRLPSVSQKYEDDLHRGDLMIRDIRVILENTPLDVNRLNSELRKAIDYIYTLYNNVNNLVGMAVMVENTIVFGNRYRSTHPEIDSELTRAELCFRNGQYTKALKIGIQCIEDLHPGTYDKLLSDKEQNLLRVEA